MNKLSKVAQHDTNSIIQKSVVFLFTNNELQEKNFVKIPFTVASKGKKYMGINLTKGVKYLYLENSETLRKQIKITEMERYVHELAKIMQLK